MIAPLSTFDRRCASGASIPIEERDEREVTHPLGSLAAPSGVRAFNPAFAVTPAELVWALIASLYLGNVMLLVLNLPMAGVWARLLTIPRTMLYAGIVVFATNAAKPSGAYGVLLLDAIPASERYILAAEILSRGR